MFALLCLFSDFGLGGAVGKKKCRDKVSFHAWFAFGVVLFLLEVLLMFACMLGMRRICVKLGADPNDAIGTLDAVLERIWVAPM